MYSFAWGLTVGSLQCRTTRFGSARCPHSTEGLQLGAYSATPPDWERAMSAGSLQIGGAQSTHSTGASSWWPTVPTTRFGEGDALTRLAAYSAAPPDLERVIYSLEWRPLVGGP